MTDLIEGIGPVLGIAAFLGLTILAFLIFQQGREVRRLREWAGRAPERASDATEATAAVAEARGEVAVEEGEPETEREPSEHEPGGALAEWWGRVRERAEPVWAEVDRRSPVDPRYLVVVLVALVVAAAVLTSGFGVLGGEDEKGGKRGKARGGSEGPAKVEVAVLNATQEESAAGGVIAGVPGLADQIAKEVVKPAGFAVGEKANASSGFPETVIMFEPGEEETADELAAAAVGQLGETQVEPVSSEVAALSGGAPVVIVVGQDDADALGGSAE